MLCTSTPCFYWLCSRIHVLPLNTSKWCGSGIGRAAFVQVPLPPPPKCTPHLACPQQGDVPHADTCCVSADPTPPPAATAPQLCAWALQPGGAAGAGAGLPAGQPHTAHRLHQQGGGTCRQSHHQPGESDSPPHPACNSSSHISRLRCATHTCSRCLLQGTVAGNQ